MPSAVPSAAVPVSAASPPWFSPRSAYVHIPFCAHHCGYCDFAVTAGQDHLIEHYIDALLAELQTLGEPWPVETLFVGGGTPTYPEPAQLERILAALNRWLPCPGGEFSVESTPDSLTDEKASLLAAHGVTRVSLGVQSFDPRTLAVLDRRHTADEIPRAVAAVRRHRLHLSIDLIFAAPGSSLRSWNDDLDAALALAPDHVSCYGLTYEKGTPLWKARRRGTVVPVGEDDELAMFEAAIDRLTAAGFDHYEVSNFARPGFRCRHNERYWANEAYLGFGVGAARYVEGRREVNTRDTRTYIRKVLSGEPATFQSETLAPRDRAFETVGTQLRRTRGIDRARFREQTGFVLDDLLGERLTQTVDLGLVTDDGPTVRLTRRGLCVADSVITFLMQDTTGQ